MPSPPCPACDGRLAPMTLGDGTTVETCPSCDGAFFARGALAKTLGAERDLRDPDAEGEPSELACPACESVLMERVRVAPDAALTVSRCPYCEGVFARLQDLPAMRALAPAPRPRARAPQEPEALAPSRDDDDEVTPRLSLRQSALALPLAALVAWALRASMFAKIVLGGARIPLHELGHATAAWLSGFNAVPVPFGVTWISRERSLAMVALLAAGLGAAIWRLARARAFAWAALFAALLGTQAVMTGVISAPARQLAITFAGSGGELVYAALLVALFHARLPARLRWDQARWIALAIGAFILLDKTLDWRAARYDDDLIPWSSVMGQDGDMQRLERDHGWTPWIISTRYALLAHACCAAAVASWLASVAGAWTRRARQGTR
ncbi:MAG: zf-TFIIB domain-containing protein [Polyangiales bacterium]